MLKEERQQLILLTLRTQGKVESAQLSAAFDTSEDTIRRDLRELAEAGLLKRVHGGGLPGTNVSVPFIKRLELSPTVKRSIGVRAARMIQPGQVVILDGGTTTLEVAKSLPVGLTFTVVTNSPVIADMLAENPSVDVILLGGHLDRQLRVTTGSAAVSALAEINADVCFLGVCSLDPGLGVTVTDYEEASLKKEMVNHSSIVVALADADKLNSTAPFLVAPIKRIDTIITDNRAGDELIQPFLQQHIEVIRA